MGNRYFTARERKITGNIKSPQKVFQWEREMGISTEAISAGMGNQYIFESGLVRPVTVSRLPIRLPAKSAGSLIDLAGSLIGGLETVTGRNLVFLSK